MSFKIFMRLYINVNIKISGGPPNSSSPSLLPSGDGNRYPPAGILFGPVLFFNFTFSAALGTGVLYYFTLTMTLGTGADSLELSLGCPLSMGFLTCASTTEHVSAWVPFWPPSHGKNCRLPSEVDLWSSLHQRQPLQIQWSDRI